MAGGFAKDGPGYAYAKLNGRLAQFKPWKNDEVEWQERWARRPLDKVLAPFRNGDLGEMSPLTDYLPNDGRILEAGCGMGQLVLALDALGYDVEGVDYAERTLSEVRKAAPHLKLRQGDVYGLDVADGHYRGYISIGVFEHDPHSPDRGLRETRRVLSDGGIACIALPHLNAERRRWLGRVPEVAPDARHNDLDFYQYYYSEQEIHERLTAARLELVDTYYYSLYAGLTRDYLLGRFLNRKRFFSWRLRSAFMGLCFRAPKPIQRAGAHMAMYVCRAV